MTSDALFWFDFKDAHRKWWHVYLASPELVPMFRDGTYGVTFFKSREIFINVTHTLRDQDETLMHELLHVAFGEDSVVSHATEEKAVSAVSPALYPVLAQFALSWPERPRGYDTLRRRAVRDWGTP